MVSMVFAESFGAEVSPDPDLFIRYIEHDATGREEIQACAGISYPENGEVFLEQYLDAPVEEILSAHAGEFVDRRDILQVSSIASVRPSAGMELIQAFPLVFACLGRPYAAMTMTGRLAAVMQRVGVVLHPVCQADGSRLPAAELARWGRYYATRPVVGYGHISEQTDLLLRGVGRYVLDALDIRLVPSQREELAHAA
ncbi:thermostable hemolysin [Streptomyces sp. SHP 1-2]|nr:thermostable hemolysin [Streptomyces sp. SHP 1-2]MYU20821.1 hypothetical protein [Streptomyces sp. SID8352]